MLNLLSVSQLNTYLKELFEVDPLLQSVWIQGEVSNCTLSSAGHLYFTLKDDQSQLRCVAFRGQIARYHLKIPNNGDAILAHGRVGIYEATGAYQLYVDLVQPEGTGALQLQFEEVRARLEAEGLFDESRKRPLPAFPQRIGVVTSPTGAVINDIINVLTRRYPLAEIILAPAQVQGNGAADTICDAIAALNERTDIDVIVVARGGGSIEDLWPFNEETVARAIYASRVPVVSGVGHETDFTIADMVADRRAPTPSAAAELISPDIAELSAQVAGWRSDLIDLMRSHIEGRREGLGYIKAALQHASPATTVANWRQRVEGLTELATLTLHNRLALERERLSGQHMRLASLNPLAVLQRGYSICWHQETKRIVSSTNQVAVGDHLLVRVSDGSFDARAE